MLKTNSSHTFSYLGNSVVFHSSGAGPRLLLIHGFAVSSVIWSEMVPLLSEQFEVVTLDLPGFGTQAEFEIAATAQAYLAFIAAAISALQPQYVLGYSMSANLCYHVAAQMDPCVRKLILLSPAIQPRPTARLLSGIFSCIGSSTWMTQLIKMTVSRTPCKQLFFASTQLGNLRHPSSMTFCMRELRAASNTRERFRLLADVLVMGYVSQPVTIPTTVIVGEKDGLLWFGALKHVLATLEAHEVVTLLGGYHLLPRELPQELVRVIRETCR